jgi:hypothetical protein
MIQQSQADVREDHERYVARATTLIHAPETTAQIQQMLGGGDPVKKIVRASVMIMQRLDTAARQSNLEVHDTVKMFAANEIVGMVAELGEASKKFAKVSPRLLELALSATVQDYIKGEIKAGRINPQKLQTEMQANMRALPEDQRKEAEAAQLRIQQTAREYSRGGK